MAEEQTHNEAGEQAPSTVEKQAPDVAEENAPATSEPEATSIPTANAPEPEAANPETNPNAAEPKEAKKPAAKRPPKAEAGDGEDAKPARAKKEKGPSVEDKPFTDFIQQDYLPALKEGLSKQGIQNVDLKFEKRKIEITGFTQAPECSQVIGHWNSGAKQPREFIIYFLKDDINGQKGFSYSESTAKPSTLESFLIDERKVNLGLLVFGVLQRLNAQKWLVRN